MKYKLLKKYYGYLFFTLFGCVLFYLYANFRILILNTPSLPYRFCVHLLKEEAERGELCILKKNGVTVVKYLVGVEGDVIRNIGDVIFVGSYIVGEAKKVNYLTPIKGQVIPAGYVFVAGTHEDSFDSRYKEFGLIKRSELRGKAIGFWKW
jgi:conjugal transfer pilin signal peptidase TrbI